MTYENNIAYNFTHLEITGEKMESAEQMPYLKENGELIITSNAPAKYKWWAGGQSVKETLEELEASEEVMDRYISKMKGLNA
ncbi:MAG: hypothetical protein ACI8PB_005452 [Desulforhopalus sp.]